VKTLAKLLYVQADEEITDLVDRLRDLSLEDEVTFVVPDRARSLQSAMSFRLLKRYADSYGKKVNLVSPDARLQAMALEAGFVAFPSMAAYDVGTQVHQPAEIDLSETPTVPVARTVETSSQTEPASRSVATLERPRPSSVVSAPPKKASRPSGTASSPPLKVYRPYAIAAGVLISLFLLIGLLYLPTASATLLVSGTPVKTEVTLNGAPGAQASGDQFPTQAISASQSVDLPGTPTGQKPIAAVAATGQVTFTPNGPCIICAIPKGTHVSSGDVDFLTQSAITVSGPTSVSVVAAQPGAAGNVPAGSIQSIKDSGLLSLLFTVTNAQSMSGGADARTATIIQQSDIDSVRDAYARDAVGQVQDQLNSKAAGKKCPVVGGAPQVNATSDHKVGEEVNGFTVTVKVAGNCVAFDEKAVQSLLKSALERKIPSGTQLTSNVKLDYQVSNATADGNITLAGTPSGFYTPVFLQSAIRSHIKGMSPDKAHAFLQSLPNVVDARVTQSPFGLPWLPLFTSRISLKIQEVASSSAS
jgi:hypothetical protein